MDSESELEISSAAENADTEETVEETDEEGGESDEFIPGFATVEDFCKDVLTKTMQTIQQSHRLPQPGDDYEYYSSFPAFQTFSKKMGARMRQCMGKLVRHEKVSGRWPSSDSSSLPDPDELFESLVDCNDVILERASTLLDEASGLVKRDRLILPQTSSATSVASWNKGGEHMRAYSEPGPPTSKRRLEVMNIPKPQLEFKELIDNSKAPFVPLLTTKPNALRPLSATLPWLSERSSAVDGLISSRKYQSAQHTSCSFGHPYDYEIQVFKPTEAQLKEAEPINPLPLEDTPLVLVETEEQLQDMVTQLKSVSEFAVDLEHHSYHSFLGLLCLMQVSTRSCDFIVDTLKLRRRLGILNEPFTDPKIVKVMHGADWDVLWLQRDCGVYVVNLFDTSVASHTLAMPRHSLAYLLAHYCRVEADKQYQLADWRVRPLPHYLLKYAREDTHYLLYIWDKMRNELLRRGNRQSNLLLSVTDRSREVCLKRYEKPQCGEQSYLTLYNKSRGKRRFSSHQLEALRLLYNWRDQVARDEDESTGCVLPNHMLMHISQVLPREPQGVLACCTPVPPLLQQHLTEVHQLVVDALKVPYVANPVTYGLPPPVTSTPPQSSVSTSTPSGVPETSLPGYIHRRRPSSSETPQPVGPPVTVVQASEIDIMTSRDNMKDSEIPEAVRAKLIKVQLSFGDPFEQFCVPSPAPPPLLMGLTRQHWLKTDNEAVHGRSVSAPAIPASSLGILSLFTATEQMEGSESSAVMSEVVSSNLKEKDRSDNMEETGEASVEEDQDRGKTGQLGEKEGRSRKRNKKNAGALREHFSPGEGRRRQRDYEFSEPSTGADSLRKKPRKSPPEPSQPPQPQQFEAFDYSKKTFADLAGPPHKASRTHFDPNQMEAKAQSSKQQKKGSAPRSWVHQRSGQRSSTYTPKPGM